ncbi:AraC family transcriptional regulator [Ginsengibacter hankyongi]|uniref:AraC family transcriptional regulator n=1 Tax=Ginsengibacter hankyongi TaxID=2607284 RepID=A0A5J5ILM8_9BACT|nr:AraC family transcriptional regulator [Ginsengibacter hankyongi]
MPQPLHAIYEYYLTFFLKDKFCTVRDSSGKEETKTSSLVTFFTESQGCVYYQGSYVLFCVQFKSNGLFAIFGIPQKMLINSIIPIADILGNGYRLLNEQLGTSKDIFEMSKHMDKYLVQRLLSQNHNRHTANIANCSNLILSKKGNISLDNLAYNANMSCRNFERRFIDEIGMSPKLYSRIVRFYNAIENKMLHPEKAWTDITYEGGYYDQAHFIKEVKMFAAKSPQELFMNTPPPKEEFIEK